MFTHNTRCLMAAGRHAGGAHQPRRSAHMQRHHPVRLTLPAAPCVLHIDRHDGAALVLDTLLLPAVQVRHVQSLAQARRLLQCERFDLIVLDPDLPDGDASELLPLLLATPVLIYSAKFPDWCDRANAFLPKRYTPYSQLWGVMAHLLDIDARIASGEAS